MFSDRNRRVTAAACGLAIAMAMAGCTHSGGSGRADRQEEGESFAGTIVLAAHQGSGLAPGDVLPAERRVCLRANETLTLLTQDGERELRGPGCWQPATKGGTESRNGIRMLLPPKGRVRTGAVRGAVDPPRAAEFFVYHGSKSALDRYPRGSLQARLGKICLRKGELLTLVSRTGAKLTLGEGCDTPVREKDGKNSGATVLGQVHRTESAGRAAP